MNLTMSAKERDRSAAIRAVDAGQITREQPAEQLGISVRHVGRSLTRYRTEGHAGLIHRSRGRSSNRRCPEEARARAIELIEEHYRDFGPTLAAERLAERHGIFASKETVRQWKIATGLHTPKRRKREHGEWRERRPCISELLQIDGSQHLWLEGRGELQPDLLCAIDDATGHVFLQFAPAESTEGMMRLLRDYIRLYGRPLAICADRQSIFQTTRQASVEEQLQGVEAETQLGRALRELGIEYIPAYSRQAKRRVARSLGTLQDRLTKELRLEGNSDLDSAHRFLKEHFIDDHNERFAVKPTSTSDAHR